MKAFKGFNKDLTCRNFQYEEGKTYKTEEVTICKTGFHACEYPLDCFNYYVPNKSVYYEVELYGKIGTSNEQDSKVCATEIKIGAKLDIADLVKAAIDFTMSKIKPEAKSNENYDASSATGYRGASSATGSCGVQAQLVTREVVSQVIQIVLRLLGDTKERQKAYLVLILYWLTGMVMKMNIMNKILGH